MQVGRVLLYTALVCLLSLSSFGQKLSQEPERTALLEVVRHSWEISRDETLVYLRVYSDGFAEAHPMWKVDFRHLDLKTKQLPKPNVEGLIALLIAPATTQLDHRYERFWGNKDFGSEWHVTISATTTSQSIELVNFQPFLARNQKKPYPHQLERLACSVWKIRSEVTGEPLEHDYLTGCADLGY
jgi:hypothetical protein